MNIKSFTFNPFQENTYVLFDDTKECIIIDPGCHTASEEQLLFNFIEEKQLKPVAIVNTHNHIDHVFGVNAVAEKYNIPFYCHEGEIEGLQRVPQYAPVYGMSLAPIMEPTSTINEESKVTFGNTELEARFTPGHSVASLCFIDHASKQVIAGDVLFQNSIGRADLPGGNYETLMKSIMNQLMVLDDDYSVFPGHGPSTTIGEERRNNPFIKEWQTMNA